MSKFKFSKSEIALYGAITCVANLIATFLVILILKPILPRINNNATIFIILLVIGVLAVSLGIIALFFKRRVPQHYQISDNKYCWLKQGLLLVLPGELFRFLLSLFTLGNSNSTGLLSILPTFLFENTYMIWSGRHEAIRQKLNFVFLDFIAYIGVYLPYIVVYLIAVLAIYRAFWNVGKREREEMIVHESRPRFY